MLISVGIKEQLSTPKKVKIIFFLGRGDEVTEIRQYNTRPTRSLAPIKLEILGDIWGAGKRVKIT